jgi:WD40 repeat protein
MSAVTSTIDPTAAASGRTNPFPGLRPFREDEESLFFGRESQVDAMVDKLAATRFLSVVGTSGSGKSSLVNCGLRPALHRGLMANVGTTWRMAQFRPGADPVRAMAGALAQDGVLFRNYEATGLTLAEIVETSLRMSRVGLIDIFEQARLDDDVNLLVVVDQFEELFRYRLLQDGGEDNAYGSSEAATAFVNLLLGAREAAGNPIYVVLTMRSDFLGDCAQFPGLAETVNDGQYLVPRLTRDERRAAIAGPIAVGGAEIEPVLLTQLLNDVGDTPDQLSILQHALNRTWARWQGVGGEGPLGLRHYEAIGTMARALDQHAERAFAELGTDREEKVCEKIFKALTDKATDPRGVRRPTRVRTLRELTGAQEAEVAAVINVFRKPSRSFLMPPAREPLLPETVVDISHESLMRVWQRLNTWADEEAQSARAYRRLAELAAEHEAGEASLLRDPELQFAVNWRNRNQPNESWASRYHPGFATAMLFLQESEHAREKERRAARRRVLFLVGLLVIVTALGLVTSALGVVAFLALRDANEAKNSSHAQELAANAEAELPVDPHISLYLARDAFKQKETDATEAALRDAVDADRILSVLPVKAGYGTDATLQGPVAIVAGKPEQASKLEARKGGRALTRYGSGMLEVISTRTGKVLSNMRGESMFGANVRAPGGRILDGSYHIRRAYPATVSRKVPVSDANWLYFSDNGLRFVTVAGDRLDVWNGLSGRHLNRILKLKLASSDAFPALYPGRDGLVVATVTGRRAVRIWNTRRERQLAVLKRPTEVNDIAFARGNRYVAVVGAGGLVAVWNRATRKWMRLHGDFGDVKAADFSPDGTRLVTGGADGTARIWSTKTGKTLAQLTGHAGPVVDVRFSPKGTMVATAGDTTARLWGAWSGARLAVLRGHSGFVLSAAFDSTGQRVITTSADGTVRIWASQPRNWVVTHPAPVDKAFFSKDGSKIVTDAWDRVRVWDEGTGRAVQLPESETIAGDWRRIHGEGHAATLEMENGAIRLRISRNARVRVLKPPHGKRFKETWMDRRGRNLLATTGDGKLWLLDPVGHRPPLELREAGSPTPKAFSPNGTRLVTAGADDVARVWDLRTGDQELELRGHRLTINDASFSSDGSKIVTAGGDKVARVWDSRTGKQIAILGGNNDAVVSAAFAPDGKSIVTASLDGTARIYPAASFVPRAELLTLANRKARVPLTSREMRDYEALVQTG